MKSDDTTSPSRKRTQDWFWPFFLICLLGSKATAISSTAGPYSAIVVRNSFGLKPPSPTADTVKPPPPISAEIKLQGITTILGRKQVLMKIKMPAKPPEPAKDEAVVLSEGQRKFDVEVLEINPTEGKVRLKNAGTILALNMKDDAERPAPGAAAPRPTAGHPGTPHPTMPGAPVGGDASAPPPAVETFGGNKTIPTRTLRSGNAVGLPGAGNSGNATAVPLNAETAAALYMVNRAKNEQLRQSGVPIPKMPRFPLPGMSGKESNDGQ